MGTALAFFLFYEGSYLFFAYLHHADTSAIFLLWSVSFLSSAHRYTSRNLHPLGEDGIIKVCPGIYLAEFIYIHIF